MTDPAATLDRIDTTLTYYSAGLGEDLTVPVGGTADLEPDPWEAFELLARQSMNRLREALDQYVDDMIGDPDGRPTGLLSLFAVDGWRDNFLRARDDRLGQ